MGALLKIALQWLIGRLFGGGDNSADVIKATAEEKQAAVIEAAAAKSDTKMLETHDDNKQSAGKLSDDELAKRLLNPPGE